MPPPNHSHHTASVPPPPHTGSMPPSGQNIVPRSPWSPDRFHMEDDQSVSSRDSLPAVIENPIIKQAQSILSRVMGCSCLTDPKVSEVIENESDYQLANFISKTLEASIKCYRSSRQPEPIGPPKKTNNNNNSSNSIASPMHSRNNGLPGPVPSHSLPEVGRMRQQEYPPTREQDGLYGLKEPLLGAGHPSSSGADFSRTEPGSGGGMFVTPRESPWSNHSRGSNNLSHQPDNDRHMDMSRNGFDFEQHQRHRRPQRRESPVEFNHGNELFEPPYKRKNQFQGMGGNYSQQDHHHMF